MWIISGPFDGQKKNEVGFKKTKLLKTGSTYSLGRKERQLTVNHGKVSHDHGAFTIASYSLDNVSDPSVLPSLSIHNAGKKAMAISRGGEIVHVSPSSTEELQDGDTIDIVGGVSLSVQWRQICCLTQTNRAKSPVSLDACASLGISLVYTPHSSVTHHLVSQFLVNPSIATSLLSAAQFVKLEWLIELIRLGNLPINDDPSNGSSLEQVFSLPAETKYRPTFGAALPTPLKVFKVWEPNEGRINMFRGYRFLFVGEKGREAEGAMTELVIRGGGNWVGFNVASGRKEWHHVLAKEKAKLVKISEGQKGVVIVADAKAMAVAVGSQQWGELVDEAKNFDLNFVMPDIILQVVLHIDTALIDAIPDSNESADRSSPLPDFVPNTHPEELSYAAFTEPGTSVQPSRNLKRRATPLVVSRPSTPTPETSIKEDEAPLPRKPLKRRAKALPPSIIGIDDPSVVDNTPAVVETEFPAVEGSSIRPSIFADTDDPPIPTRSLRLKRRAGTIASSLANTQTNQTETIRQEPPLKKFKALFDASHPDRYSAQDTQNGASYRGNTPDLLSSLQTSSQTQSGVTTGHGTNVEGARLGAVAEEEEESGMNWTQDRGIKRKSRTSDGEDDIEMAEVDGPGDASSTLGPTTKRRAVEDVNAVQPSSRTGATYVAARSKPGSAPVKRPPLNSGGASRKPDTDAAFLKAVASTKRGKKAEDEFDREFNKLKISKPDVPRDEQEKEWAVLDDFAEDRGIRGNFMVVLEMDIYSKGNTKGYMRDNTARPEWQNRPNFKKFKKKSALGSRTKVELVVQEENDYGMGSAYWKGNSQSQSQGLNAETNQPRTQKHTEIRIQTKRPGRGRGFVVVDSDEDVEDPTPHKSNSVPATKAAQNQNQVTTRVDEKARPLFLDSDEDNENEFRALDNGTNDEEVLDKDAGEFNNGAMTLQSSTLKTQEPSARQTRSSKPAATKKGTKVAPVIVDDDSDDGATFKGFRGKKRGTR